MRSGAILLALALVGATFGCRDAPVVVAEECLPDVPCGCLSDEDCVLSMCYGRDYTSAADCVEECQCSGGWPMNNHAVAVGMQDREDACGQSACAPLSCEDVDCGFYVQLVPACLAGHCVGLLQE